MSTCWENSKNCHSIYTRMASPQWHLKTSRKMSDVFLRIQTHVWEFNDWRYVAHSRGWHFVKGSSLNAKFLLSHKQPWSSLIHINQCQSVLWFIANILMVHSGNMWWNLCSILIGTRAYNKKITYWRRSSTECLVKAFSTNFKSKI